MKSAIYKPRSVGDGRPSTPLDRPRRRGWSAVADQMVVCLILLAALSPRPAQAHAILIGGGPAPGATVPAGHLDVHLRYNSRIDQGRSRLTLTAPDHAQTTLAIIPAPVPDVLNSTATVAPGAYVLRWQVLAVDGHITRGDIAFTVAAPR